MSNKVKQRMENFLSNICSVPGWHGTFNKEEIEYFMLNFSDLQVCNGNVRCVMVKSITDNCFKIYSECV